VSSFETTYATPVVWVADQLARLPARPLRCAVVLVAAERQAHAIRRHVCVELGRPESLAGVHFLRPIELARELMARSGRIRRPGWEEVRRLRILQLFEAGMLAERLRYFRAEQLSGQGYVDAFARTIADLEASGIDAALAAAVAEALVQHDRLAGNRLHDVAVTWQAADAGSRQLASTAEILDQAARLASADPQLLESFGPVLALLPAPPSTMLLRFVRALRSAQVVFQDARPQREQAQRWRRLVNLPPPAHAAMIGSELSLVQRYLFEAPEHLTNPDRPRSCGADGSVDVEEYASLEDEIESAATWVSEQITTGTPAEQIAVIVPDIEPYGALLADRLARLAPVADRGALRTYVAGGQSLATAPAGMRVQKLLHALARGLAADATIRMLPDLRRHEQDTDDSRARLSASRAAAIVYGAGIVGGSPGDRSGVSEWYPRLLRRRDAMRVLADAAGSRGKAAALIDDDPEKRLDARARHDAARWLRDVEPILPAIAALQTLAEAIQRGIALPSLWDDVRAFCERWLRLPPDPPNLLARLAERLQPLLTDAVAQEIRGAAALRLISDLLHRERGATARFGEPCIFVGTPSHAAGLSFAAVRVLGLVEGALPHTPHDDPIVPDNLRKRIEEVARERQPDVVVPRLVDHVLDEIHDVFRVVSGTRTRLALSAPRQWVDHSEREVSGIVLEIATALGRSTRPDADDGDVPTAARLRAAYLNTGRAARARFAAQYPLTPRTLVCAAIPAHEAAEPVWHFSEPDTILVPAGWTGTSVLAIERLWQLTSAASSDRLLGPDEALADGWRTVQPPGLVPPRPLSASGVALLLGCPYRFLLERILHFAPPPPRPSTDVIAPATYGTLFHAAAERFFHEVGPALCRREGQFDDWVARARTIAGAAFDELRHEYPMRGEDGIARERERLLRQIEQLVRYEWEAAPREFLASEWSFGDPESVRLEVEGGELYVRGAIDRIDRLNPEALAVRDLKTGRVRDFGEEPISAGRDLQIGVYVLALEALGYGGAPVALAAYVHPSAALEPDRAFEGRNMDVLRRHTREWLGLARTLLSAGAFPRSPNPDDCLYCPFVPACGEGAQQRSAAKLNRLPAGHPLEPFARFKRTPKLDD
jgi:RecB family exonuclease